MRTIIFCFVLLLMGGVLQAQAPVHICGKNLYRTTTDAADLHPCGTPSFKSQWLKEYQKNPAAYQHSRTPNSVTYLPLTLHIVGNDDSTGYGSLNSVLSAFCKVNQDYKSTGIQFFIEFPIRYIANTAFNDHDSVYIGGGYMLQYNVPNTSNVYFVSDPAGNCGYNVPYAGMTVGYGCLDGNTFSHELGHALSIMHPFFGWEGGQSYNGTPQMSFPNPAPTEVLYDYTYFKDTMWLDTTIVDTTEVEYVTRAGANANCYVAADGFCDTPADYLAYRWTCDASDMSTVQQLDPDSVAFYSEGTNIMSYSTCLSNFTNEQAFAMNAFIQANRQSHLYNQNPMNDTIDIANFNPIAPANGAVLNQTTNITFRWNSVPGATHYFLKVCASPCSASNLIMEEVMVTDTFFTSTLTYNPRISIFPYRWQVRPFNQGYSCAPLSTAHTFNTQNPTNLRTLEAVSHFGFYPNPQVAGQGLTVEATADQVKEVRLHILSIAGQTLLTKAWTLQEGQNTLQLATNRLQAGAYFVVMEDAERKITKKLIISK